MDWGSTGGHRLKPHSGGGGSVDGVGGGRGSELGAGWDGSGGGDGGEEGRSRGGGGRD